MKSFFIFLTIIGMFLGVKTQRAPPGVNPQHYQYQQQPQYQQQVPQQQQYQQVPVQQQVPQQQAQYQQQQQQQIPVQQQYQQASVQQQVPMQQVHQQQIPVQHQAAPHEHHQRQIFNTGNLEHEKEHIQEHMEVPIDTSKMTDQELQFHYFKMHDADNNNKLDGCELIKSLIHWHVEEKTDGGQVAIGEKYDDKMLSGLVDDFLKESDTNFDGFVDWYEYKTSARV